MTDEELKQLLKQFNEWPNKANEIWETNTDKNNIQKSRISNPGKFEIYILPANVDRKEQVDVKEFIIKAKYAPKKKGTIEFCIQTFIKYGGIIFNRVVEEYKFDASSRVNSIKDKQDRPIVFCFYRDDNKQRPYDPLPFPYGVCDIEKVERSGFKQSEFGTVRIRTTASQEVNIWSIIKKNTNYKDNSIAIKSADDYKDEISENEPFVAHIPDDKIPEDYKYYKKTTSWQNSTGYLLHFMPSNVYETTIGCIGMYKQGDVETLASFIEYFFELGDIKIKLDVSRL